MRGIWAGYPLTVQLSLDKLYMFTFMHPFRKKHQELILLCKYKHLFCFFFKSRIGSHMYFIRFYLFSLLLARMEKDSDGGPLVSQCYRAKKTTQERDSSTSHQHTLPCKHVCSGSRMKTRPLNTTLLLRIQQQRDLVTLTPCFLVFCKGCRRAGKRKVRRLHQPNSYVKLLLCSRVVYFQRLE